MEMGGVRQLLGEPLVSAWSLDVLSKQLAGKDPVLALAFHRKADAVDPARRGLSLDERVARY
jgi:hypothetical protein